MVDTDQFSLLSLLLGVHEVSQVSGCPLGLAFAFLVGLVDDEALQQGVHSDCVHAHEESSHQECHHCD